MQSFQINFYFLLYVKIFSFLIILIIHTHMKSSQAVKVQGKNKLNSDTSEFQAQPESGSGLSYENSECVKREKIQKLKKKKRRMYNTKSKGNWNNDEDYRFVTFMLQNRESFQNKDLRRSNKIFKKMAKLVRTRCPEQCRSHHQKCQKKYETFDNIIASITEKIDSDKKSQVKIEQVNQQPTKKYMKIKQRELNKKISVKDEMMDDQRKCIKLNSNFKHEKLPKTTAPPLYQKYEENENYMLMTNRQKALEIKIFINVNSLIQY